MTNRSAAAGWRAVRHIENRDLKELWVPDPAGYRDIFAFKAELVAAATDRLVGLTTPDKPVSVDVPKNHFFYRRAVLLSPIDQVAYHAALVDLQPEINRLLPIGVMSGRSSGRPDYLFENGVAAWLRWRRRASRALLWRRWCIRTDLASYFDTIRHDALGERMTEVGASDQTASTVITLLECWSQVSEVGVPQGPDISRLLGNLYLLPVDRHLAERTPGVHYSRYMDDVLVAGPRRQVIDAFKEFEDRGRGLGLAVSSSKTRLMERGPARKSLTDYELTSINFAFSTGARGPVITKRIHDLVLSAIDPESGQVDGRRTRFGLRRLIRLNDSGLDGILLDNLEYFAPAAPLLARYFGPRLRSRPVIDGLIKFLTDPDRNISDYLSTWLVAALIDSRDPMHHEWVSYAWSRLGDPHSSRYERAMLLSLLGRTRKPKVLDAMNDLMNEIDDPWIARAAAIGLSRGGRAVDLSARLADAEFLGWTNRYLAQLRPGRALPP